MKRLINRLQKKNKKIAVAESCTGGLISKKITDTPGASAVFECGVTAYSNDIKIKLLGVKPETLAEYGAVSEQTVIEMACGVLELSGADIAVSVSGIAGPGSDNTLKPVGTVCIGIATKEKSYAATFVFAGKRSEVRKMSCKMALDLAFDELGIKKGKKGIVKTAKNAVKKLITKSK